MYYEEKINEIKKLIKDQNISKAYSILSDELSMDYIPKKFEIEFDKLFKKVNQKLFNHRNLFHTTSDISFENIKMALTNDSKMSYVDKIQYISQVKDINPLSLEKYILNFLKNKNNNNLLKTLLVESLSKSNYNKKIVVNKYDQTYKFYPKDYLNIYDSNVFLESEEIIKEHLYIKAPNLYNHAIKLLEIYFANIFPKDIPSEDSIYISISIIYFLLSNFGLKNNTLEQFCMTFNCPYEKTLKYYFVISDILTSNDSLNNVEK